MDIGNGVGFWKTMPILARISVTSILLFRMFSPSRLMLPSALCSGYNSNMRLKVRSSVLLPQPDGPMKAVTLRSGMSRLMCLSAWKLP